MSWLFLPCINDLTWGWPTPCSSGFHLWWLCLYLRNTCLGTSTILDTLALIGINIIVGVNSQVIERVGLLMWWRYYFMLGTKKWQNLWGRVVLLLLICNRVASWGCGRWRIGSGDSIYLWLVKWWFVVVVVNFGIMKLMMIFSWTRLFVHEAIITRFIISWLWRLCATRGG